MVEAGALEAKKRCWDMAVAGKKRDGAPGQCEPESQGKAGADLSAWCLSDPTGVLHSLWVPDAGMTLKNWLERNKGHQDGGTGALVLETVSLCFGQGLDWRPPVVPSLAELTCYPICGGKKVCM